MKETYVSIFEVQTGKEFEDEFINLFSKDECKRASKEDDLYKGTDAYLFGIPVDITFNFTGKDNCQEIGQYKDWHIGIRTGNAHSRFKTPVIVIGVDYEPTYVSSWIIPNMKRYVGNTNSLIDKISDCYWAWIDNH